MISLNQIELFALEPILDYGYDLLIHHGLWAQLQTIV
jgi:hypothetical protein